MDAVPEDARECAVSIRFPWNRVKSFTVKSLANGSLLIEPTYTNPNRDPEEFGGPSLFTRMALAKWCEKRLAKRETMP